MSDDNIPKGFMLGYGGTLTRHVITEPGLWKANNGEEFRVHNFPPKNCAFVCSHRISDGMPIVWDIRTGEAQPMFWMAIEPKDWRLVELMVPM